MQTTVTIIFAGGSRRDLTVDGAEVLGFEPARRWLDDQFVQLECEPFRGSGKVLIADKIIAVALAVGEAGFAEPAWALDFARAASGALSKALVKVDLDRRSVSY